MKLYIYMMFPSGSDVNLPVMRETRVWSMCQKDPPEKGMATHSRILAWRIPWAESRVCCSPWGHKESDTTEMNWTELILMTVKPYLQLRFLPCWGLWVLMFQFEWKLTCHHLPMCPAPPPLLLIKILSWWLEFPSAQSSKQNPKFLFSPI